MKVFGPIFYSWCKCPLGGMQWKKSECAAKHALILSHWQLSLIPQQDSNLGSSEI